MVYPEVVLGTIIRIGYFKGFQEVSEGFWGGFLSFFGGVRGQKIFFFKKLVFTTLGYAHELGFLRDSGGFVGFSEVFGGF